MRTVGQPEHAEGAGEQRGPVGLGGGAHLVRVRVRDRVRVRVRASVRIRVRVRVRVRVSRLAWRRALR